MKLINSAAKGGSTIFKLKSNSMVQPDSTTFKHQPINAIDKAYTAHNTLEVSVMKSLP
jgi:hypothetical protein